MIDRSPQEGQPGTYGIEQHAHLFAAWAASRAASVKGGRFRVEQGRKILEACDLVANLSQPEQLPTPSEIDAAHRAWRANACTAAGSMGLTFTHGIAAKLINCYLKSRFVCGGHHLHERVAALHPPIDKVLLETLGGLNVGGHARAWRQASRNGWSRLNSEDYDQLIALIRGHLNGKPLWMIEEYWKGNQ